MSAGCGSATWLGLVGVDVMEGEIKLMWSHAGMERPARGVGHAPPHSQERDQAGNSHRETGDGDERKLVVFEVALQLEWS